MNEGTPVHQNAKPQTAHPERDFLIGNLLVRIHEIIENDLSRPALRHGILNSFLQVA